MQSLRLDLQIRDCKIQQLEAELENSSQLSGNNDQIAALRKSKNELLAKVKDQVQLFLLITDAKAE